MALGLTVVLGHKQAQVPSLLSMSVWHYLPSALHRHLCLCCLQLGEKLKDVKKLRDCLFVRWEPHLVLECICVTVLVTPGEQADLPGTWQGNKGWEMRG